MDSCTVQDIFPGWSNTMLLVRASGLILPVLIPYIHIGIIQQYWTPYKCAVDREECTCACWDTVFKGSYQEWPPTYKHLYFNVTWNSLLMWVLTVLAVVVVYETSRHLVDLWMTSRLRVSMTFLLLASLYPHYYTWWAYVNAFNDDFYGQFLHQAVFSLTEICSSVVVLYLADTQHRRRPRLLLFIVTVAIVHVLASATDQFIANVLHGEGAWHQWTRDLGFMTVDMLHIIIASHEIVSCARNEGHKLPNCISKSDCFYSTVAVGVGWCFIRIFLS